MLPSFANHTVDVLTAGVLIDRGKELPDWNNPLPPAPLAGCLMQPMSTAERELHREFASAQWVLYAPPGAPITESNRIGWQGAVYEVVGFPLEWAPGLSVDHTVVYLKRREG